MNTVDMNGVTAIPVMSGIPNLPSASLVYEEFYQLLWQEKKKEDVHSISAFQSS